MTLIPMSLERKGRNRSQGQLSVRLCHRRGGELTSTLADELRIDLNARAGGGGEGPFFVNDVRAKIARFWPVGIRLLRATGDWSIRSRCNKSINSQLPARETEGGRKGRGTGIEDGEGSGGARGL